MKLKNLKAELNTLKTDHLEGKENVIKIIETFGKEVEMHLQNYDGFEERKG